MNILTFIIPVRHPHNCKDWSTLKKNLAQTMQSIAAQGNPNWGAIIVANEGSDLPVMLKGFEVIFVTFKPNPLFEQGAADRDSFYDNVRLDKGRRVLVGMLNAEKTGHFMVVDDDDFIHNSLTSFVSANPNHNGWRIKNGYVWEDNGKLLYRHSDFSHLCGTSHIIRTDLYNLPDSLEKATDMYIKQMLGSHIFIDEYLKSTGNALEPLPFYGAIYRIGHRNSHSKSLGLIQTFFPRWIYKKPKALIRRSMCLRYKTKKIRKEFYGNV